MSQKRVYNHGFSRNSFITCWIRRRMFSPLAKEKPCRAQHQGDRTPGLEHLTQDGISAWCPSVQMLAAVAQARPALRAFLVPTKPCRISAPALTQTRGRVSTLLPLFPKNLARMCLLQPWQRWAPSPSQPPGNVPSTEPEVESAGSVLGFIHGGIRGGRASKCHPRL